MNCKKGFAPKGGQVELEQQPIWSEKTDQIVPALLEARKEMVGVKTDEVNAFWNGHKYASLTSVLETVSDSLHSNGLVLNHSTLIEQNKVILITEIIHISGQWKRGYLPIINKKGDDQGQGSSLTYSRRQGILAILSIPTIDDDGEDASDPNDPERKKQKEKNDRRNVTGRPENGNHNNDDIPIEPISKKQKDEFVNQFMDLEVSENDVKNLLKKNGFAKAGQITQEKLPSMMEELKKLGKQNG